MRVMIPGASNEQASEAADRVRKILEAKKPLYLANKSSPRSIIFISYTDAKGDRKHQNFPDSYLPVCVTDRITPEQLLESPDLWSYISAGLLVPVPSKKAKEMLSTPEAEEERTRLKARTGRSTSKVGRTIQFRNSPTGKVTADSVHPERESESEDDEGEPQLNKRLVTIMAQFQEGEMSEGTALSEIKSISEMTREDYGYLVSHGVTEDGRSRISDYAMERLQKFDAKRRKAAATATTAVSPKKAKSGERDIRRRSKAHRVLGVEA